MCYIKFPSFSKCNPVKSKNYLRNKYNLNNYDEKIFIYVGFLSPGRGIEPLLDFFSNHNHHHLVLLGYGPCLVYLNTIQTDFLTFMFIMLSHMKRLLK